MSDIDPRAAGNHWRRSLRRDIGLVLAFKFAALILLWGLFFSAAHQPRVDASAVGRLLTGEAGARADARVVSRRVGHDRS